MNDLLPFLRTADSATRDQLVSICGQAADEIDILREQKRLLAMDNLDLRGRLAALGGDNNVKEEQADER